MSTKAKIQKVRNEIQAHEDRGWLKGYEEGLAVREEETVNAQNANAKLKARIEKLKARIKELKAKKSAPKTAREALDLAWELAHPVKEGQTIPEDTEYLRKRSASTTPAIYTASGLHPTCKTDEETLRTLDPLPEPEPDWLDAPAVLASTAFCDDRMVWTPERDHEGWSCDRSRETRHWSELTDVTPLYPKEDA